jgi:hypothetical protein
MQCRRPVAPGAIDTPLMKQVMPFPSVSSRHSNLLFVIVYANDIQVIISYYEQIN